MKLSSLLHLERQRFFPNTTFRMIVLLYVLFFALLWILAHLIGEKLTFGGTGQSFNPAKELFLYPRNWELLAYIGSWLNSSLIGFLGVFMITLEFNHKTLRQSVIFGLSRKDLFQSKVGSAVALALAATVWYVVLGCFGARETAPGISADWASFPGLYAFNFFLQSLGYFLLGTLTGLYVRQTALATLVYFAYAFFLESLFRWFFWFAISPTKALLFLPDRVFEGLTPFPIPQSVSNMVGSTISGNSLASAETIAAALAYIMVFTFFLHRKLCRSDL